MSVSDTHLFPGFLTPVLTQLFFPKPTTTFLTCFSKGKYAGKRVRLNQGSNSQPPGHESDTLTTEPPVSFETGDPVYYRNNRCTNKLERKWKPFHRIIEKRSPVNYDINYRHCIAPQA